MNIVKNNIITKKIICIVVSICMILGIWVPFFGGLKAKAIGVPTFTAISGEYNHSAGVTSDGKVYSWGDNTYGQLGNGLYGASKNLISPYCISNIIGNKLNGKIITSVKKGDYHTLALDSNGKVYAWGRNNDYQLGTGGTVPQYSPICISDDMLNEIYNKVVIQIHAAGNQSYAVTSDGKVYSWGRGTDGVLGDGTGLQVKRPGCITDIPGNLLNGKIVTEIRGGNVHTLALTTEGKIYAWGQNTYGQLGDDTVIYKLTPICISDLSNSMLYGKTATTISAGGLFSSAIADGKVYTWGTNTKGQLGDTTTTQRNLPVCLTDTGNSTTNALFGITPNKLDSGAEHSLAIYNGKVYVWGSNTLGLLGDSTSTTKIVMPICISDIATNLLYGKIVTEIVAASTYSLSLTSTGKVYTWGKNDKGQLGNNTIVNSNTAVPIHFYECVLTFNSTDRGSIGDGTTETIDGLIKDDPFDAPTVEAKFGYAFVGWDPVLPTFAPQSDTTYTAQYVKTEVVLTQTGASELKVNIKGQNPNYQYQIWGYEKVTSDLFLDDVADVPANQWILLKEYTQSAYADIDEEDGSISFFVSTFTSPDNNYTVSVKMADDQLNYFGELRDSYTPEEIGEVTITKVKVDGNFSKDIEIKETNANSSVQIEVVGNNVADTTYKATLIHTKQNIPTLDEINPNIFLWDTSNKEPGIYTIRFEITNGITTDIRDIDFQLYSLDPQGIIENMEIEPDPVTTNVFNLKPIFSVGRFFYTIGEPGRAPIIKYDDLITTEQFASMGHKKAQTIVKYGIYSVYGFVKRPTVPSIDDVVLKTLTIKRSETIPSSTTLTADVDIHSPIVKGSEVNFTANATIGGIGNTQVQYSFWRYSSVGFVLIKDWSNDNTLDWTPARVGDYVISVRAKGIDADSYETDATVKVSVTDSVEYKAEQINISINQAELDANATARIPIVIKAVVTSSNSDDLLVKYNIDDDLLGVITVQDYSPNQDYIWIPRKPGIYRISVLVKNSASFGMYDSIKTFTVSVS